MGRASDSWCVDDDLTRTAVALEVPVFFLQGRYDQQTVFSVTREYFERLEAPRKEFVEFERSAHLVPYEEPEKFNETLVRRVLPLARSSGSTQGHRR